MMLYEHLYDVLGCERIVTCAWLSGRLVIRIITAVTIVTITSGDRRHLCLSSSS